MRKTGRFPILGRCGLYCKRDEWQIIICRAIPGIIGIFWKVRAGSHMFLWQVRQRSLARSLEVGMMVR